ncbi:MAG TPA: metallophosphoesterase [Actinomycetota bacterium]|nr:metallophosphoesterase [Actinomycetota bacterium]
MSPFTPARAAAWALALALAVVLAGCGDRGDSDMGAAPAPRAATSTPSTIEDRPAGPVRSGFVAFGDFGGGPAQQAVADAMERWTIRHQVDALVTTGDNVYERGEPERFAAQLDRPYAELRRSRPLWVSLGNHDVAAGHGAEQLRHLGLPDHPYAKTLPGVQLLLLDSNRVDQAQTDWLERQLAGPGPRLRVVVFHHPAWSCSRHDSTEEVTRRWGPVLERHRVALVLNGHDHNYQRFTSPAGVTYVVTGGGGKPLYPLDDDCPEGTPTQVAEARRHHFTAVEVRDRSLAVTAVADDGSVLDRTVIRR